MCALEAVNLVYRTYLVTVDVPFLVEQGVELETIALLMRHESPGVTFKCYIGVTQDRPAAAMEGLAPMSTSQSKY